MSNNEELIVGVLSNKLETLDELLPTRYNQTTLQYTCGAGVASVNVANGRLLFEHSDMVVGGGNFTIGINHIYDSYGLTDGILKKLNMKTYVGEGWKLNIQQYLFKYEARFNLAEFTTNDYLYIDEKGYYHRFINIEGDSSRWNDTSGLGMVLKSIAIDENISHNAISFLDGSMLLFSKSTGCLIESRKMTNYTTYISKVYEYQGGKITRVYDLRHANGKIVKRYLQFDYNKNDLLEQISLMPNDIKNDSIFFGYDEKNSLKYIVDYVNEKEKGIVCFGYNLVNLLITATSTTHKVGLEFLYGDADEIRNVKKGHTNIILCKNISYEKSTYLSLNQVISVNDFFIAVAEEKTDLLSIDIKKIKDDEILEVTSYKYAVDYKSSNQEIKTIVTNKNDVSFVYYLNQKGFVVSVMENYVDTNLKTLTKDGGILYGDDGKLMNCINGSSMIKANIDSSLKKIISFDSGRFSKYHDSNVKSGILETFKDKFNNYIVSFWFKSKSKDISMISAKVKVSTYKMFLGETTEWINLESPITYIDHTAYNSWQYVNVVINGEWLDEIYDLRLELISGNEIEFEYANVRIAAATIEELTLSIERQIVWL